MIASAKSIFHMIEALYRTILTDFVQFRLETRIKYFLVLNHCLRLEGNGWRN